MTEENTHMITGRLDDKAEPAQKPEDETITVVEIKEEKENKNGDRDNEQ